MLARYNLFESMAIMGPCSRIGPILLAISFLFIGEAKGAVVSQNGGGVNLENRVLSEFASSLRKSGGGNGLQQTNPAMLHPYLQKLLTGLGSARQGGDEGGGEGLLSGVTSEDCKGHLIEWAARFSSNDTDVLTEAGKWVLQMIDSWAKIPEGVLSGHINSLGDFSECIEIKARDIQLLHEDHVQPVSRNFEGRYCTAYILDYGTAMGAIGAGGDAGDDDDDGEAKEKLNSLKRELLTHKQAAIGTKGSVSFEEFLNEFNTQRGFYIMVPSIGVCLPNSCSLLDIQHILINLLNATYAEIPIEYPQLPQVPPELLPWPLVASCKEEKKPDLDAAAISVITLLSIIAFLALSAAVTDFYFDKTDKDRPAGLPFKYFMAFSIYTNTRKWLSTRKGAEDFGCIHGIRFFSTAWVVFGHTFEEFASVPPWNMFDVKNIWKNWAMLTIANGTFSVDTFFVLSGTLATYSVLKLLKKSNGKLNLIMFYIHRYIRLTPTYAIAIGINATLLIYMGNGPFSQLKERQQVCRDNWWVNLLYISSVYRIDKMCIGQSWYIANDFLFYILVPFIVWPIWKREKVGLGLLAIYTAVASVVPVLIVRYHGAQPAMAMTGNMDARYMEIYFRPWPRVQTFLVGVWLGWLLFKTQGKRINIPRIAVIGLWLCSTGAACAVIFGIQPWFDPHNDFPEVAGYFYAGLSRFTFAVVVSWVIFACIKGYGGIVNDFLSWKVFMPLGRLCFCVFLVSMQLQHIYHGRMEQSTRYDIYTMVNIYFGHLVMSNFIGFIFTLLFESPFIVLQKLIFEGDKSAPKKETKEKVDA